MTTFVIIEAVDLAKSSYKDDSSIGFLKLILSNNNQCFTAIEHEPIIPKNIALDSLINQKILLYMDKVKQCNKIYFLSPNNCHLILEKTLIKSSKEQDLLKSYLKKGLFYHTDAGNHLSPPPFIPFGSTNSRTGDIIKNQQGCITNFSPSTLEFPPPTYNIGPNFMKPNAFPQRHQLPNPISSIQTFSLPTYNSVPNFTKSNIFPIRHQPRPSSIQTLPTHTYNSVSNFTKPNIFPGKLQQPNPNSFVQAFPFPTYKSVPNFTKPNVFPVMHQPPNPNNPVQTFSPSNNIVSNFSKPNILPVKHQSTNLNSSVQTNNINFNKYFYN